MQLSIIVPVYNVEKYLSRCIESVLNTKWGEVSYEMIIVDDESPDNSLGIAERYQEKNSNIRIISQKNKGLGGARNTGMKSAVGDYLFFLDSDDYIVNNEMPNVVRTAIQNQVDIIEFASVRATKDYQLTTIDFRFSTKSVLSSDEYLTRIDFADTVCNKLYRREFLQNQKIIFLEKVYIEDTPFNVEALSKADRIMAVDLCPRAYYDNPDSITRSKRSPEKKIKMIEDSIKVTHQMSFYRNYSRSKEAQNRIKARVSRFCAGIVLMIIRSGLSYEQKGKYIDQMRTLDLYPCPPKTYILIRDIFLTVMNQRVILNLFLRVPLK